MRQPRQSYAAYSIGCAVVWAGILGALTARGGRETLRPDPALLRWLVDGMDVGHDRSVRLSATEVSTTTDLRSTKLIRLEPDPRRPLALGNRCTSEVNRAYAAPRAETKVASIRVATLSPSCATAKEHKSAPGLGW